MLALDREIKMTIGEAKNSTEEKVEWLALEENEMEYEEATTTKELSRQKEVEHLALEQKEKDDVAAHNQSKE